MFASRPPSLPLRCPKQGGEARGAAVRLGQTVYLPTGLISSPSLGISRTDLFCWGRSFHPDREQGLQGPEEGACESRLLRGSSAQGLDRGRVPAGRGGGASDTHILGSRSCPRSRGWGVASACGSRSLRDLCGLTDSLFRWRGLTEEAPVPLSLSLQKPSLRRLSEGKVQGETQLSPFLERAQAGSAGVRSQERRKRGLRRGVPGVAGTSAPLGKGGPWAR